MGSGSGSCAGGSIFCGDAAVLLGSGEVLPFLFQGHLNIAPSGLPLHMYLTEHSYTLNLHKIRYV